MRVSNGGAGVPGNGALKLKAAAVATIVIAFPVLLAISFLYPQATLEIGVILLWILCALTHHYSMRCLMAVPLLAVAFVARLALLQWVP